MMGGSGASTGRLAATVERCCSVEGEEEGSLERKASRLRVTALVEARGLTAASSRVQFWVEGLRLVGATEKESKGGRWMGWNANANANIQERGRERVERRERERNEEAKLRVLRCCDASQLFEGFGVELQVDSCFCQVGSWIG